MIRTNRLIFCFGGVLLTGCALPKMNSEWDDSAYSGEANAGGTKLTAGAGNGGSNTAGRASGQAGRTNTAAGGTTSSSGASSAGQSATLGGSSATGGIAGASVSDGGVGTTLGGNASGGTSIEGGTSSTGGKSSAAGNKATGGASSNGGASGSSGSSNTAGALSRGGASGSGGSSAIAGALSSGGASSGGVSSAAGTSGSGGASGNSGVAGAAGSNGNPVATAIAAGWYHSCALLSDGTVRCWGDNCNGRLGDGGVASRCTSGPDPISSTPIHVQGIAQATAVACGGYHTCAIVDEGANCPGVKCGTVKCWGSNLWGQLGYSSTSAGSASPVNALGITTATAVVAGQNHTCALLSDTSVKCWGQNAFGQLGAYDSISEIDFPAPVVVDGANTLLTGVTKLSTSGNHTCAIVLGSQVYCWGDNRWSQLGTSTTDSESYVAIPATRLASNLGSLTPVVVGAGNAFSCALVSDGSARCWGSGTSGELGNAAEVDSDNPVKVAFSVAYPWAADLSTGYSHACAILANGTHTAQCWGSNNNGEIGNADSGADVLAPADVTTGIGSSRTILTQVQSVAAGRDHTCAIANGVPYCWGYNGFGALGTGDTNSSTTARLVTGF